MGAMATVVSIAAYPKLPSKYRSSQSTYGRLLQFRKRDRPAPITISTKYVESKTA